MADAGAAAGRKVVLSRPVGALREVIVRVPEALELERQPRGVDRGVWIASRFCDLHPKTMRRLDKRDVAAIGQVARTLVDLHNDPHARITTSGSGAA